MLYIPPHIHLTETDYREVYGPVFVDFVRRTLAPFSRAVVIDHFMERELTVPDMIWLRNEIGDRCIGLEFKSGYLTNAVGKLKSARTMVRALIEAGVPLGGEDSARYVGSAWENESRLPKAADYQKRYVDFHW